MSRTYRRNKEYNLHYDRLVAWKSLYEGIKLLKPYLEKNHRNRKKSDSEFRSDIKAIETQILSTWSKRLKKNSRQSRILKEIMSIAYQGKPNNYGRLVSSETCVLKQLGLLK